MCIAANEVVAINSATPFTEMNQTATAFVDVYETAQPNKDNRVLQEQQVTNVHDVYEPPFTERNQTATAFVDVYETAQPNAQPNEDNRVLQEQQVTNVHDVHEPPFTEMNQTATAFVDVYETAQPNEDNRVLQEQQVTNVHDVHEPPTPEKNYLAIEGKQAAAFHGNDKIAAPIASNWALEEQPECDNADMIDGSPSTKFLNINATPSASTDGREGNVSVSDN
jgi:hypothetical protein